MSLYDFSWVIDGELAGMAMPDGEPDDWRALAERGVGAVVNLTDRRWRPDELREAGLAYLQVPIPNFEPPTEEQVARFVGFCDEWTGRGGGVAVHCLAGMGRTGTMIACYLVRRGLDAEEAIRRIRRMRPGSIETPSQEAAVRAYARRRGEETGRIPAD